MLQYLVTSEENLSQFRSCIKLLSIVLARIELLSSARRATPLLLLLPLVDPPPLSLLQLRLSVTLELPLPLPLQLPLDSIELLNFGKRLYKLQEEKSKYLRPRREEEERSEV